MKPGLDKLQITSLSAIEHILEHRPELIRSLRVANRSTPRLQRIEQSATEHGIACDRQGGFQEGEGAIATLAPLSTLSLADFISRASASPRSLVVALDHVQDPHNLGAICRTAEAFGTSGLLLPRDRSATITAATFSASAGAIATLPVCQVPNLNEALRRLKEAGFWIVGSTLGEGATPLEAMPDFEKVALVLGAERQGMAALTEKLCDWKIQILLPGKVQSLNVSAAAAVLIHDLMKRHASG